MTKYEFLDILRMSLQGEVPDSEIQNNIQYYSEYISSQVNNGVQEEDVFSNLGDPRLIAKTIIDTYKISHGAMESHENNNQYSNYNDYGSNNQYYDENVDNHKTRNIRFGEYNSDTWYKKLLRIGILILVIFTVIFIGGIVLKLFFTIGIPILIILFLYNLIFKR